MKRRKFINVAGVGTLSLLATAKTFGKITTVNYHIEQFKDKGLAHYSYAILVKGQIIIVDPERNPEIYYDFARQNNAVITGVIETHPHADFASSHLEIHQTTNAKIYASSLTQPAYPLTAFDEGGIIKLSDQVSLRSLYTPGHAPDHIAVILEENGKDVVVFSGDSLLIGDVGRPDLRDYSNNVLAQRKRLAAMMYHTIHEKFAKLNNDVIVYPAHGAGSLCGKAMRDVPSSTIGYEKAHNYAFQPRSESDFVQLLISDLPFIPKYFPYDVALNVHGALAVKTSITNVNVLDKNFHVAANEFIIDGRPAALFKNSYITDAINIQDGGKFETWLGSVVAPDVQFYLTAGSDNDLAVLINKAAKIGYEANIKGAFVYDAKDGNRFTAFDNNSFNPESGQYTIIDVRTAKEVKEEKIFSHAINIPLQDLASRIKEVPTDKPILVSCGSGYRSAAGSSIIKKYLPGQEVFDLGTAVTQYEKVAKAAEKQNTK
ncbi:MBL fold metallo-hydrolase [Mucilaginibacter sp. X5P1]|uniref:MBL fold metallo-hydrolase n=1 Tax=Mucilaginibacter sp. X5P1 TaxID=2723088 RepID=UPI001616A698|nr:MBL fold metallo-hydrolase [Mucilaginibacter sp. X5P1]MBB6137257.1 glyoxylase-like metal-dependent hydrolase (beta-lactamase superfamily II)/rhodanese-related sulfurtransferase [Mucilaginibacter sp. X5P1]